MPDETENQAPKGKTDAELIKAYHACKTADERNQLVKDNPRLRTYFANVNHPE